MPNKNSKMKVDITENYIRRRQINPNLCNKSSFRIKQVSPQTKIILCNKRGSKKQVVQSILEKRK